MTESSFRSDISWYFSQLSKHGDSISIVFDEESLTYAQLISQCDEMLRTANEVGMSVGDRVLLVGDFNPRAVSWLMALLQLRAIVIPIVESSATRQEEIETLCEVSWVIRARSDEDVEIKRRHPDPEALPSQHSLLRELCRRENPGLILFTSGSTGNPKAVVHDFTQLLQKFRTPARAFRTLTFLLFDHWGGLNTLFHSLVSGSLVVFPRERSADYICRLITKHQLELLPASPSFLNMVLVSGAFRRHDLSSLKMISYGAEPMPPSTLRRLRSEFPNIQLKQTYGLIELGVMQTQSKSSDSLLVKLGGSGYETRVVDGMLEVRAKSSMLGYLNAPAPFTQDGFFRTGDQVEQEGDFLRIIGRASEIINVGGEKVYPAEVENILLGINIVADAVVYGSSHPISGQIVCADVVLVDSSHDQTNARTLIRRECGSHLEKFKIPIRIRFLQGTLSSERQKRMRRNRGEES